jgi:hypothetical protein
MKVKLPEMKVKSPSDGTNNETEMFIAEIFKTGGS